MGRINHVNISSCWLPNQLAIDISKDKKLNLGLLHILLELIFCQYTDLSLNLLKYKLMLPVLNLTSIVCGCGRH